MKFKAEANIEYEVETLDWEEGMAYQVGLELRLLRNDLERILPEILPRSAKLKVTLNYLDEIDGLWKVVVED